MKQYWWCCCVVSVTDVVIYEFVYFVNCLFVISGLQSSLSKSIHLVVPTLLKIRSDVKSQFLNQASHTALESAIQCQPLKLLITLAKYYEHKSKVLRSYVSQYMLNAIQLVKPNTIPTSEIHSITMSIIVYMKDSMKETRDSAKSILSNLMEKVEMLTFKHHYRGKQSTTFSHSHVSQFDCTFFDMVHYLLISFVH